MNRPSKMNRSAVKHAALIVARLKERGARPRRLKRAMLRLKQRIAVRAVRERRRLR